MKSLGLCTYCDAAYRLTRHVIHVVRTQELEVIEGIRGQLHQKVNQAFEQIW